MAKTQLGSVEDLSIRPEPRHLQIHKYLEGQKYEDSDQRTEISRIEDRPGALGAERSGACMFRTSLSPGRVSVHSFTPLRCFSRNSSTLRYPLT